MNTAILMTRLIIHTETPWIAFGGRCFGMEERMLTERQMERIHGKLKRFEHTLEELMFRREDEVSMAAFDTDGSHHEVPAQENFVPCRPGYVREGEGGYCWFRGSYTVPERLSGKNLFIYPRIEGYEGMLWVNKVPYGNFASKLIVGSHGNHYCDLLKKGCAAGDVIDIALEYYANHYIIGTQPFETNPSHDFRIVYHGVDICVKDEEICDFYYELRILNEMAEVLGKDDFKRAEVQYAQKQIHEVIYYDYENADPEEFREGIRRAKVITGKVLAKKNSESAPYAGFIGHSHMDTAWLWHRGETEKKCARTYSNQISLMDQYPDYTFMQSSAYHGAIIQRMYPELFEEIKKRVAEGRYEPNGGAWIECDCNIPGGEYMIRQFLWGQRFTRENFNYTSDCFWLPDTFGYSAALPQIMNGCGIKYFLTTKIAWNDTNIFPYDTFYWKGIDGSRVLVHFNRTHIWPSPKSMVAYVINDRADSIKEKTVADMRLLSYGFGDGGGGPEFEMVELANRLGDVEGLPKSSHTTVSEFMQRLEKTVKDPSIYAGELYLELHRGTLTNQHTIKRNNRKAEIALRDLEYLTVRQAAEQNQAVSGDAVRPLMESLLINQFHDILPGTCITRAHQEAIAEVGGVIRKANERIAAIAGEMKAAKGAEDEQDVTVMNTLSFDRTDVIYLPDKPGYRIDGGYAQQSVTDLKGSPKRAVMGVTVPAFGSVVLRWVKGEAPSDSAFCAGGNALDTPVAAVRFNEKGYLDSYVDKASGRELRGEGYALNTFLLAEDVSSAWDNWDVDADLECKFADTARLESRAVVSDGPVEYRVRSSYRLTEKSTLDQDMIFYADRLGVVFETRMNWQDEHRFLKTAFDTSIFTDTVRQEVQFGYIKRSTNRNTSIEKAKFEVSNHKYSDLSEMRYGAAVLNDSKYGIGIEESKLRLSLHKGGNRPDTLGDKGIHSCVYAFLPHNGEFGTKNVIRPAYELNYRPIITEGSLPLETFLEIEADNIIAEAVKPSEDGGREYIVRLYEAEGASAVTKVRAGNAVRIEETNMLEETTKEYSDGQEVTLTFRPFEIKTIRVLF